MRVHILMAALCFVLLMAETLLAAQKAAGTRDLVFEEESQTASSPSASTLCEQGQLTDAIAAQEKLLPEMKAQYPEAWFDAQSELANLCLQAEQWDKARQIQERLLAEIQNDKHFGPKHMLAMKTLFDLGRTASLQKDYSRAVQCYEDFLPLWRAAISDKEHPITLTAMSNLAAAYYGLGHFAKAIALNERVAGIYAASLPENDEKRLSLASNLSGMYLAVGDYTRALELAEKVVACRSQSLGAAHVLTLQSRNALANTYEALGDYETAFSLNSATLDTAEETLGQDHEQTLLTLGNLAAVYANRERPDHARATALLKRVQDGLQRKLGPEHPDTLLARLNYARSLSNTKHFAEARELYTSLLPLFTKVLGPRHTDSLALRMNLAVVDLEQNKPLDAIAALSALLPEVKAGEDRALTLTVLRYLREACQEVRDLPKAEAAGKEAVELAQAMRAEIKTMPRALQVAFAAARAPVYQGLADVYLSLGRIAEAQAVMALLKEEELADMQPAAPPQAVTRATQKPDYTALLKKLGKDVALVQLVLSNKGAWCIVSTSSQTLAKASPLDASTLNAKILAFRDILQDDKQNPRALGKDFYDALIAPIAAELEAAQVKTLMFELDGTLRYIPMAALYDGQKWPVQRYAIAMFNEAAQAALTAPPSAARTIAGLGVTKEHKYGRGTFSALPAVREELATIVKTQSTPQGILPGLMSLDEGFTDATLKTVLDKKYPVVHLASHFHFNAKNPDQSFLLLGDGSALKLQRIAGDEFNFKNVDLLALSACQTARGGVDATGKEVEGFGALAQKRGAKAVLATLWPVFDESTGLLMSEFYALRKDSALSSAQALRQAQLQMIEQKIPGKNFSHPFYWAPFVLMGDWR